MKIEELKNLQPTLFHRFVTILEQGRLAHAYLFSGDFASYDMAIFLSQSLFCQEKDTALPCQTCRTCRLIEAGEFSDVTLLAPQGNIIKTDTVRELVKNFSQSGFESSKQVFIIRDAEKMHANAANSLLKVMEEPQSDIHLFLLTNQEEAVLPTIKSRTQIVGFPKNIPALERMLEEEGLLKKQANLLACLVASREEAIRLARNKSFIELLTHARKFTELLISQPEQAYLLVSKLVSFAAEKSDQERVFDALILLLSERMTEVAVNQKLELILQVKKMWQVHVSFQNCLEYLVLSS